MKTIATDVVVVGGGPAGMSAALTCCEKGIPTIIVEKDWKVGGNNDGLNGFMAVDSRICRTPGNEDALASNKERFFWEYMEHNHWQCDPRIMATLTHNSGTTIEWYESYGVKFSKYVSGTDHWLADSYDWNPFEGDPMRGRPSEKLLKAFLEKGGEVLYHTTVKSIIMEDGRAVGVKAVDKDGEELEIRGKAVVITTGGYGDNAEMIKEYTGLTYGDNFLPMRAQLNKVTGDGINMCWDVGAGKTPYVTMGFHAGLPQPYDGPGGVGPGLPDVLKPYLLVNKYGERFMSEKVIGRNPGWIANAMRQQPDAKAWIIIDSNNFENAVFPERPRVAQDDAPPPRPKATLEETDAGLRGIEAERPDVIFCADSLEELAQKTGIELEGLLATIKEYNEICETGEDWFFKDPGTLVPFIGPKYYAARLVIMAYGSLGGVLTDHHARVLNTEHRPIPGLYCSGMDASPINGSSYHMEKFTGAYGGFGVTFGREAGRHAAEYIKTL